MGLSVVQIEKLAEKYKKNKALSEKPRWNGQSYQGEPEPAGGYGRPGAKGNTPGVHPDTIWEGDARGAGPNEQRRQNPYLKKKRTTEPPQSPDLGSAREVYQKRYPMTPSEPRNGRFDTSPNATNEVDQMVTSILGNRKMISKFGDLFFEFVTTLVRQNIESGEQLSLVQEPNSQSKDAPTQDASNPYKNKERDYTTPFVYDKKNFEKSNKGDGKTDTFSASFGRKQVEATSARTGPRRDARRQEDPRMRAREVAYDDPKRHENYLKNGVSVGTDVYSSRPVRNGGDGSRLYSQNESNANDYYSKGNGRQIEKETAGRGPQERESEPDFEGSQDDLVNHIDEIIDRTTDDEMKGIGDAKDESATRGRNREQSERVEDGDGYGENSEQLVQETNERGDNETSQTGEYNEFAKEDSAENFEGSQNEQKQTENEDDQYNEETNEKPVENGTGNEDQGDYGEDNGEDEFEEHAEDDANAEESSDFDFLNSEFGEENAEQSDWASNQGQSADQGADNSPNGQMDSDDQTAGEEPKYPENSEEVTNEKLNGNNNLEEDEGEIDSNKNDYNQSDDETTFKLQNKIQNLFNLLRSDDVSIE